MTAKFILFCGFIEICILSGCYGDSLHTICAFRDDNPRQLTEAEFYENHQKDEDHVPRDGGGEELEDELASFGEILPNNTIQCPANKDFCYSLWLTDSSDKTKITLIKQGCWDHPECTNTECVSTYPSSRRFPYNNTRFCCCTGDMCNYNVSDLYVPGSDISPSPMATPEYRILPDPNYKQRTIIIALVSVFCVALVTAVGYLTYRLWCSKQKDRLESVHLMEAPPTPTFELDQLKICSQIDRGRYGEVWRGTLGEMDVAIKMFSAHQKQYYLNEKDIFMLPYMEHDSLVRFYGAEERIDSDGVPHYIIVLQYISIGTLCDYLRQNVIDWVTLCRMCHSVASGLAHLHTDITRGDKVKPAIAHRDFNTRNILVLNDLSCVICDFGFAMKIMGSKFFRNGQEENAEQTSLTDVGTLRYMAPEVLEGAVNLRDCEASLKQIDVYSLGLVLWEIATRCSDLYQGMPVPEYKLPFEEEIGSHITFEAMQLLVSRKKARPKFPDVWKDSNQAIRSLKETIEDCWDQDAEARLTSLCVEERILEMITLWEARHKGITPTINSNAPFGGPSDQVIVRNPTSNATQSSQPAAMSTVSAPDAVDRNGNVAFQAIGEPLSDLPPAGSRLSHTENSVSTSTTDTTLISSPSEPSEIVYNKANRNLNFAKNNRVLQPFQGQNPTVERNTHKRSDEELAVLGNTLVDKSVVEAAQAESRHNENRQNTAVSSLTDELIDAIADNLESSLVQNDILSHQQRHPPIPYVQNQVHSAAEPLIVRPKKPNVPGNGLATHSKAIPSEPKQKSKFKFKKPKEKGKLSLSIFGRNPFSREKAEPHSDDSGSFPTENLCDPLSSAPQIAMLKQSSHHRSQSDGGSENGKSNLVPRPVSTEVRLVNGTPTVRPTTLPITGQAESPTKQNGDQPASGATSGENRLGIAEVGVAKLQSNSCGQPAVMKMRQKSQSNVELSPTRSNPTVTNTGSYNTISEGDSQLRRPNSLSVSGHNYNRSYGSLWNNTGNSDSNHNIVHGGKRNTGLGKNVTRADSNTVNQDAQNPADKVKKRIKTPLKNGRFSLYDDRMMSQSITDMPTGKQNKDPVLAKSSISLHQFGSVETDMNRYPAADFRC